MDRIMPGVIAIIVGSAALVVVFVPLVALSYRRRGGFSGARLLGWIALLFYVMGLWAYTLLPLPDGAYDCVGVELNPFAVVTDIARLQAEHGGSLLRNPAFQQLVLNILLFLPLGFFARALFGRGVLVAAGSGAIVSLAIEVTQLTGVWGLFPCAYRLFDTGDLAANTVGAVLGSAIAAAALHPWRGRGRATPATADDAPVTAGRRVLAMVVDLLTVWLTAYGLAVMASAVVSVLAGGLPAWFDPDRVGLATTLVAIGAQAWSVLAGGVTIGERVVLIEAVEMRPPKLGRRVVRFAVGIGGYTIAGLLPGLLALVAPVLAIANLVGAFTTRGHRGFAQAVAGMDAVGRARPATAKTALGEASSTTTPR
ncbi:VanZ family protein [Agromyces endophyticus]|uniref:VanZ family protein n=1 Tax=Agromyces sp. H17E-10 TaxID=2932244 RepID=UPI001FD55761|nr:VanZ family protein [Agromyces sp. H17E-10]UOQ89927.1 VanZ family protein [Agromyces sp. H17E-10]